MSLKEEFTTKMHSELSLKQNIDVKHKAMNVWCYGIYKTEEEQKSAAISYGISWEQALFWKNHCLELKDK